MQTTSEWDGYIGNDTGKSPAEKAAIRETLDYLKDCLKVPIGAGIEGVMSMLRQLLKDNDLTQYVTGEPLYDTKNNQTNAIKKALQSKLKSVYNRELKRIVRYQEKAEPLINQHIVQKQPSKPRDKIERGCVEIVHPDDNGNWSKGITKVCLDFCRVGLANFSTFASFFYYFRDTDPDQKVPMIAKLKASEDGKGKDVVFVVI